MSISRRIELPVLAHRELTSQQFLDGCRRITFCVLEGTAKIPLSENLVRELANDCALVSEELACRLMLDRKGEFTRDKLQAHAKRINFVQAVRRELKTLFRNPDPAIPDSKRTAAKELLVMIDKHTIATKRRSQAEVSTMVQGLLTEAAEPEVQQIISQAGAGRFMELLKQAQAEYAAITKREEEATVQGSLPEPAAGEVVTADGDSQFSAGPTKSVLKPRLARELKEALSSQLSLLFDLMAHLARKGREPYALLLAEGCEISAELNQVAKTRETRERKAEEKRKKQQQAEGVGGVRAAVEPVVGTARAADGESALAG
jgi:hypothetical protein